MRRVALVFVVAIFAPSLALAWLSLRSLRDQQFLLERQQALLYQGTADRLATEVDAYIVERQREFGALVEKLMANCVPAEGAVAFDTQLRQNWPIAEVGFVVSLEGQVLAPSLFSRPEAREFRLQNGKFLCNQESAEVYWQNSLLANTAQFDAPQPVAPPASGQQTGPQNIQIAKGGKRNVTPQQQNFLAAQQAVPDPDGYSKVAAAEAEFRQLIGDSSEGRIARFLQDKLNLLLWYRSPRDARLVFGAQLDLGALTRALKPMARLDPALARDVCVAILDDRAQPITLSHPDFRANWKRPFVATELGEALPHWEAAVYLLDPNRLQKSANLLRLTIASLVALLVAAIAFGGSLVVKDLRRQLTLARQKTDFVSNVSHELKTPLTSIRMFSELLADGRVADESRQRHFLRVINAEAARLTRLINNVLDFARIDRGEKKYNMSECDLSVVVREVVDSYRPHLESNGFRVDAKLAPGPVMVHADCDALSQVLVNLLSNAEKYSPERKEITVELEADDRAVVRVLDRGVGVPSGSEQKIFEQFYRAHDSLACGIQGSGLGLTLARQIARAHGGDVTCEPRAGGGSCFAFYIPQRTASGA